MDALRDHTAAKLITSSSSHVLLALDESGAAIGFAITTTSYGFESGLIAELEDRHVSVARRPQGVAGALIEASPRWARDQGCTQLEGVTDQAGARAARPASLLPSGAASWIMAGGF